MSEDTTFDLTPESPAWDAFTELASTMADEMFPTAVPLDRAWPRRQSGRIVWWLVTDPDMRLLVQQLLDQVAPKGEPTEEEDL